MKVEVVLLALLVGVIFDLSYFFFIQFIQKRINKKTAKIANTFLYEITPKFSESTSFVNYVLLFGIAVTIFPFIYYLIYNFNNYSLGMAIAAILLAFCLCCIPFIGLNKLREHLYLDVGAIVLLAALIGVESLYMVSLYRLYRGIYQLIAMIVALVLFASVLVLIINPKLFDLKNEMDEEGNPKRKRIIFLALSEWLLYPLSLLSLVPLILISAK